MSLFLLLRGYFFCRDSCGPPYILLNKKQRIRVKKDYYSDNDRRFPCWTVAHSFQNVNFANAMFDSEFYRQKIIENLRTLLRSELRYGRFWRLFSWQSSSAQIGSSERWEVWSLQSSHVVFLFTLSRLFALVPILYFLSNCKVFFFFLCLLKYIREVNSRILCAVQDNWMLLLIYCENAWSYHVLN